MISLQLFKAGFCRHCERMTLQSGSLKQRQYPASCALINHPKHGFILFDTGYSADFFQLTKYFPFSLYRYLTPVTLEKSLKEQLLEQEIQPEDIQYIVISHFHADHIGGLKDFPNARFICHQDAFADIQHKNRFRALLQGVLPGHLPKDFAQRVILIGDEPIILADHLQPFSEGYDLFHDQQLIAISLPGHAKGHIGLYLQAETEVFLIADSCWHRETFSELIYPSSLSYLIQDNKAEYIETIKKLYELHQRNPNIEIIPAHCERSLRTTTFNKNRGN